jgi:hypothetical protein
MGLTNRKPLKGVKKGDSITTKKLKEHNLLRDSPLTKAVRSWKVESVKISDVSLTKKKKMIAKQKTVIVLTNGKGENLKRTRTFWIN